MNLNLNKMDTSKIEDSIDSVKEYLWADERAHFLNEVPQEDYDAIEEAIDTGCWHEAITYCERTEMTHHVFYHLLVLEQAYEKKSTS
jgi:hypothetical protein